MIAISSKHIRIIGILGVTQVCSWGSIYYAITILANPIMREMQWSPETVFGAFSLSLLVGGISSTFIGKTLDRLGARPVMALGSLINALGLYLLASEHQLFSYFLSWILLGIGMGMTLYEAAFAMITQSWGSDSRQAISTLTLFGGFASTLFWPLTLFLETHYGWRNTYLIYALIQLLACFPLHLLLDSRRQSRLALEASQNHFMAENNKKGDINDDSSNDTSPFDPKSDYTLAQALRHPSFWKIAFAFATNSFIFSALSIHFIPTLVKMGHLATWAVFMSTLIGPMQVLGRIVEMIFHRRFSIDLVGTMTFASLPLGLVIFLLFGHYEIAVVLFCIFYGLSNGVITIVKGTLPQTIFGTSHYGAINGTLTSPSLFARAGGPLVMALIIHHFPNPHFFNTILLICSLISLWLYRSALQIKAANNAR